MPRLAKNRVYRCLWFVIPFGTLVKESFLHSLWQVIFRIVSAGLVVLYFLSKLVKCLKIKIMPWRDFGFSPYGWKSKKEQGFFKSKGKVSFQSPTRVVYHMDSGAKKVVVPPLSVHADLISWAQRKFPRNCWGVTVYYEGKVIYEFGT